MKTSRGFTLIELLVVIAIISILAAILFPVFASARLKAQQVATLSNAKQIGLALLQYEQDYDEDVVRNDNAGGAPFRDGEPGFGNFTTWQAMLTPYINSAGQSGVWHSPGGSAASGDFWDGSYDLVDSPSPAGSFVSSFTLNNIYYDDSTIGRVFWNPSASVARIEDPADMIFFGDGGNGKNTGSYGPARNYGKGGPEQLYFFPWQVVNYWNYKAPGGKPTGGIQYYDATQSQYPQLDCAQQGAFVGRFNGGLNCAFMDGHVKFMLVSTLARVYPCPAGFSDSGHSIQDACAAGGVLPYFTTQADTFLN
jgi:prepilin-type N-terminal cleavage/methylation domain-containing protein/prepilin-type processing-associated H-X9-DG protein